jgi:hypothetical protein
MVWLRNLTGYAAEVFLELHHDVASGANEFRQAGGYRLGL